ncbi:guanosine monophosphate reductase [Candidatus Roizmanbacteria bacterium CG22_combo_CG10-13_8_21_14_all_38_20]|uniref:Guanosine monophosphate reductase n=1 Tax=Candidatus Roizmanbacteria bacterium CG22_combo_CG10-13_8_21_14_all_38_20 TaxID=1974862 RepID=A0A2H0BUF1_9BACT|nr:IMP dehydrogenase [Candidatus Microgenomates bacterium]PIP61251.1 MAG: guanosine monophosphate reductase [Candidatus Roizmanbacteria bacterium CG22_combo_CG10-13_8_21_14_all_38_20]PJC31242.1 MAG: guanosine monophosphate reductase [Candidatus Roizmanbacteria bacterium CG_4_9_14_0_2_um_filter_38_17]
MVRVVKNQQCYLTYDDVLLLPEYTDFSRGDINLRTQLTKKIGLDLPLVAAPMDTVAESKLAIALAKLGGIAFIHRNLTVADQAMEVKAVKQKNFLVGAAIGASSGYEDRVEVLVKTGVDVIVVDSAHGYAKNVIDTIKWVKNKYPKLQVIGGNIATKDGAEALIKAGADGLRVGMGPGAICTTRVISGMGVPQISAVSDCVEVADKYSVPVIADGGIAHSGDIVKALAAGAASVMMGSYFASAEESPGKVVDLEALQVPARFKSILKDGIKIYKFKEYRGMGSVGAMKKGTKIKSEDEYHGKSYKDRVMVAEGVEGLVPVKGTVKDLVDQAVGGMKSGLYYVGAKSISELQKKAKFIQITQASLTEGHPHDILVTNAGSNYQ